ncbi:MAG TPA: TetR/AcrR family transcriptional regulator [Actinomycetota bacterium]|jgi:AcrR family transcriptional regulator|nr:TetR/AcrR family transcriptional regulator [Actinomycetota bacterium]
MNTRLDGRNARSERTRRAIVDSLLEYVRADGELPTTEAIAARAGVTQRTLFNNFDDIRSLFAAAIDKQVARVIDSLPPAPAEGSLENRVRSYVADLCASMDEVSAVRWVVLTYETDDLRAGLERVRSATRARLSELLATEMTGLDASARDEALDAAELVTDPISWRLLRRQRGLGRAAATRVMTRALLAIARSA